MTLEKDTDVLSWASLLLHCLPLLVTKAGFSGDFQLLGNWSNKGKWGEWSPEKKAQIVCSALTFKKWGGIFCSPMILSADYRKWLDFLLITFPCPRRVLLRLPPRTWVWLRILDHSPGLLGVTLRLRFVSFQAPVTWRVTVIRSELWNY